MNDTIYSIWADESNLSRQIKKLQETGAFIQTVRIVQTHENIVKYEITYTDIVNKAER